MPDATLRSVAKLHTRQLKQFERAGVPYDSTMLVPAGSPVGYKINFLTLPTAAWLHGLSYVVWDALGAGTLNLGFEGFENPDVAAAPTALNDGLALTAASTANTRPFLIKDHANNGKLVWELMGLAKDPGGFVELVGTIATAATTAAGDITLCVVAHHG